MRYGIALVLSLLCAVAGFAGPAQAEKRVALVIGNSGYKHTRGLPNPKNDAAAVARLLHGIGFAEGDVTLAIDLGYQAMRETLRAFAEKAAGADMAIVYYAGHGIEVAGENYLVPVDAKLARDRDLEYEAVHLSLVLDAVSDARKLKLVILDACRNNPLADGIALRAGIVREVSRGLKRIEPKGDLLVAYSAKAGTVALDGEGQHSPFAEALMKHMPTAGIDIIRMFGRVAETVLETTGKKQEPWLYGRPGSEAIALVPAPAPEKRTAAETPPGKDGLSAEQVVRVCREVEAMSNLSVLGALAGQHKGTAAGACIAARMDELLKTAAEKKAVVPPPKAPDPVRNPAPTSLTECDRLAAWPSGAPAGAPGVAFDLVDVARAVPACREAVSLHPGEPRLEAWLGRALMKAGTYEEAHGWLLKAAEKGNVSAMGNLAALYANGQGVGQDYAKAIGWYEKAADKGDTVAMTDLGRLYAEGLGAPQDYARAKSLYEKAAGKGDAVAMTSLGRLYGSGRGVTQDYATAVSWYEKGAEKGDPEAMTELGIRFAYGLRVPQDHAKAMRWLEKAAGKGYAGAMTRLGDLYAKGLGVKQDHAKARSWYDKAAQLQDWVGMYEVAVMLDRGMGGETNPKIAAGHLLAAARAGYSPARGQLDGDMAAWSQDTRRELQTLLFGSGDYTGPEGGVWDPASRNAARSYYMRGR